MRYNIITYSKKEVRIKRRKAFKNCVFSQSFIYSPTDALVSCLKININIYIKIHIKTSPTYFGAVTPSVLTKVTVVKIVH